MHPQRRTRTAAILLATCAGAAALSLTSGCYERVISARGPGSDQVPVYEPYQDGGSDFESWLMGPVKDPSKRNGSRLNR